MNKLFMMINYKSIHDDIWQDIIDYENGTTLKVSCSDGVYTGVLVAHEENGKDSWFILEDYIVIEEAGEYNSKIFPYDCRIAINLKDVKRIELFYGEVKESKVSDVFKKILKSFRLKNKIRH